LFRIESNTKWRLQENDQPADINNPCGQDREQKPEKVVGPFSDG